MPLPAMPDWQRHYVLHGHLSVRSSVRLFICYQSCEHNILETNELIFMHFYDFLSTGQGHETINFGGQ